VILYIYMVFATQTSDTDINSAFTVPAFSNAGRVINPSFNTPLDPFLLFAFF